MSNANTPIFNADEEEGRNNGTSVHYNYRIQRSHWHFCSPSNGDTNRWITRTVYIIYIFCTVTFALIRLSRQNRRWRMEIIKLSSSSSSSAPPLPSPSLPPPLAISCCEHHPTSTTCLLYKTYLYWGQNQLRSMCRSIHWVSQVEVTQQRDA